MISPTADGHEPGPVAACSPSFVDELRAKESAIEGGAERMAAAAQAMFYQQLSDALYACSVRPSFRSRGGAGNSPNADLHDAAFYAALGASEALQSHQRELECNLLRTSSHRYDLLLERKAAPADEGQFALLLVGARVGKRRADALISRDCR
jgi:hypothetical protein